MLFEGECCRSAGPKVIGGRSLPDDLRHAFSISPHACACPLLAHSSHMCCSVSMISTFRTFLQKEYCASSVCPGTLLQKLLHLILAVSVFLMWSFIQGGILSVRMPFSNVLFVGRSPVNYLLYSIFRFV